MLQKASDPYQVLLKSNKLPMSLLKDPVGPGGIKQHAAKIHVEAQPFSQTFGPKAQRKRPKISASDIQDLIGESNRMQEAYEEKQENIKLLSGKSGYFGDEQAKEGWIQEAREPIFTKGQSKRIWNELYKVFLCRISIPRIPRNLDLSTRSSTPRMSYCMFLTLEIH